VCPLLRRVPSSPLLYTPFVPPLSHPGSTLSVGFCQPLLHELDGHLMRSVPFLRFFFPRFLIFFFCLPSLAFLCVVIPPTTWVSGYASPSRRSSLSFYWGPPPVFILFHLLSLFPYTTRDGCPIYSTNFSSGLPRFAFFRDSHSYCLAYDPPTSSLS